MEWAEIKSKIYYENIKRIQHNCPDFCCTSCNEVQWSWRSCNCSSNKNYRWPDWFTSVDGTLYRVHDAAIKAFVATIEVTKLEEGYTLCTCACGDKHTRKSKGKCIKLNSIASLYKECNRLGKLKELEEVLDKKTFTYAKKTCLNLCVKGKVS